MPDAADAVDRKPELSVKGEGGAGDEQITIKVRREGYEDVLFKIKRNAKLSKVIQKYCEKQGIDAGADRFLFEGVRIDGNKNCHLARHGGC